MYLDKWLLTAKSSTLRQHIKVPWPILNETLHAPYVLFDFCIYARFEISKDSIKVPKWNEVVPTKTYDNKSRYFSFLSAHHHREFGLIFAV